MTKTEIAEKASRASRAIHEKMRHHCHWPGCPLIVPPRNWGCRAHWYKLPKALRDKVWANYRPGQEITKTPSAAYIEVAKEVQAWIEAHP